MTATNQDFILYQGQTKQVTIPCIDGDGAVVDLTGATVSWRMYADPSGAIAGALIYKATILAGDDDITLTLVNGATGELDAAVFKIVPADSEDLGVGPYFHELSEVDALGNESPLATGWVTIHQSPAGRA